MKRVLSAGAFAVLIAIGVAAVPVSAADLGVPSGMYKLDNSHGYIAFQYTHLGFSHPILRFNKFDAAIDFNAAHPEQSKLDVTIDATSIDSGTDLFNEHLNGEQFFNTAKFHDITFKATSIKTTGAMTGTITGDLTIKGVTKPVTLNVTLNKAGIHPMAKDPAMGFSATGTLKRSDWGLGAYVPNVSDDVHLMIEAEFHGPKSQ